MAVFLCYYRGGVGFGEFVEAADVDAAKEKYMQLISDSIEKLKRVFGITVTVDDIECEIRKLEYKHEEVDEGECLMVLVHGFKGFEYYGISFEYEFHGVSGFEVEFSSYGFGYGYVDAVPVFDLFGVYFDDCGVGVFGRGHGVLRGILCSVLFLGVLMSTWCSERTLCGERTLIYSAG